MQKLEVEISTFLVVVSGAMVEKNVILALLQKISLGTPHGFRRQNQNLKNTEEGRAKSRFLKNVKIEQNLKNTEEGRAKSRFRKICDKNRQLFENFDTFIF